MRERVTEIKDVQVENAEQREIIELPLELLAQVGGGNHTAMPIHLPIVGPD